MTEHRSISPLVERELSLALRAIDERKYTEFRDGLRVNDPRHRPPPRVFVPSRSAVKP